jgi:hypothetical protein
MYQFAIKYNIWPQNRQNNTKKYQNLPFQDLPKFSQIWIFGLKIYHPATLVARPKKYFFINGAKGKGSRKPLSFLYIHTTGMKRKDTAVAPRKRNSCDGRGVNQGCQIFLGTLHIPKIYKTYHQSTTKYTTWL